MLLDGDAVVGVQLAFYSERTIDGRRERFCNLGAWCVLPGVPLPQPPAAEGRCWPRTGYHFTDLSPSGNVVGVNAQARASASSTRRPRWSRTFPGRAGRVGSVISSDPALIERTLTGRDLQLYRDHARDGAADIWCSSGATSRATSSSARTAGSGCALFVSVLHVSNPTLFREHGAAACPPPAAAPRRGRPRWPRTGSSGTARGPRSRSGRRAARCSAAPTSAPAQIDYLYSELVCVSW